MENYERPTLPFLIEKGGGGGELIGGRHLRGGVGVWGGEDT